MNDVMFAQRLVKLCITTHTPRNVLAIWVARLAIQKYTTMDMTLFEKGALPHRSTGGIGADDDAVPDTDPSDVWFLRIVEIGDAGLTQA